MRKTWVGSAWLGVFLSFLVSGQKLSASPLGAVVKRNCIASLLKRYREGQRSGIVSPLTEEVLRFEGIDPLTEDPEAATLYNPAGWVQTTIHQKPTNVFIGRKEALGDEKESRVAYYVPEGERLVPLEGPNLHLQDPFVTFINGEMILGGVQVEAGADGEITSWRTVFHGDHGKGLDHLTPFLAGPRGMKDIRLVELADGRILVFTRPQGEKGGRGKIGFMIVRSLEEITAEALDAAPLLNNQFGEEEWGGINAAYLLKNVKVGVLGHIARFQPDGTREYFAFTACFDPETGEMGPLEIILTREDLEGGLGRGAKRPDLPNVIFPGQLIRHPDGTATLWGGEGDKRIFGVRMKDPLTKYEAASESDRPPPLRLRTAG